MEPTLRAGDRVLLVHGLEPRPGTVCIVRLPDGTLAIKRVTGRHGAGWWVERDNPRAGVDSWQVGAIPEQDVLAVAVARAWPRPARLGRRTRDAR